MEGGDPGESMSPLPSQEALLRVIREVAQTIVRNDVEAGIQYMLELHQRAGLEASSKRPSLVMDAAEAYTAVQPHIEDANPPPPAEDSIAMLEEGGTSDGDETYIMPLAAEEQSHTRDSVRHSFTSIQTLAEALVNSAIDSGLYIVLAKEVGRHETLAMQRLPEDSPSVDPGKVQHGKSATAAGYLDNISTSQDVLSVVARGSGEVEIHTLAMQLVESTFNAAMATVQRSMAEEDKGQTEATAHMEGVDDTGTVLGEAANSADNPGHSMTRPGVGAELEDGGQPDMAGHAGQGRRISTTQQPSVMLSTTRPSEVEGGEGREEATSAPQAAVSRETGDGPTYDEPPPQQEDTWAAEGQGHRQVKRPSDVASAAEPGMGKEAATDPAAERGGKAQADRGHGGQRRSRASSSTAGQALEAKGGKKGKAKKGLRHETLRVRRIRQQRKRPRAPRLPAPYVPPPVPILLRHPGHESGRVLRLRTMRQRLKKIKRRKRRAAQAHAPLRQLQHEGSKVSANASMDDESLGAAWPFQPSLLARYLAHALALARSPGLEPLLHDSVLTYAGALGPRYDPLLPLALVEGLGAQEARAREMALPQPYQEELHVSGTGGKGGRGEEEPGRGQEAGGEVGMAMAEERASDGEDMDRGQEEDDVERGDGEREREMEQQEQDEDVVTTAMEPQVEAPLSSIEVKQDLAESQRRRRRRKRSLPPAQVLLEGPAASALDAYLSLAVGAAPTDPRLPCAPFPLLKETSSRVLLPLDPLAMLLSLCPPPHGHRTCSCPALSLGPSHLPPLLDDTDTASLHTLVVAYFSTRLSRWRSLLTSAFFLALGQDATLRPPLTRLSAFLTDNDRRSLGSCGRGGRVLGGACSRLSDAATRVQCLARKRQATALVSQRRREKRAVIRIQANVRGHLHGRQRVYRLQLRQRRRECLGLDADLIEALTSPQRRKVLSPLARLELTRAVCHKLRSVVSTRSEIETEKDGEEGGDPAAARALVDLGFLDDLTDQLKDHRQLPAELIAELLGGLTTLLPGIPPWAPSPLLSRAFVLHAVSSLLHPSTPPPCLHAACRFLSHLTPQRCVAFPNAFLETPIRASLLDLLSLPIASLASHLLSPSFPPPPLTSTLKTWRGAALALLPLYMHTSRPLPSPPDPLPPLLSSCSTVLLMLDLCLTSPAMARRHSPPQLRHAISLCLSALWPLTRLLLSFISPPHRLYTFQDDQRDADLVFVLKRLLALRHRTALHEAAIHVVTLTCHDVRVRRLLVRSAFSDALALVLGEQESGTVREAAEGLLKALTATVLDDMDEGSSDGESGGSEDGEEWREAREKGRSARMSPREKRMVEATALRGLQRVLVE